MPANYQWKCHPSPFSQNGRKGSRCASCSASRRAASAPWMAHAGTPDRRSCSASRRAASAPRSAQAGTRPAARSSSCLPRAARPRHRGCDADEACDDIRRGVSRFACAFSIAFSDFGPGATDAFSAGAFLVSALAGRDSCGAAGSDFGWAVETDSFCVAEVKDSRGSAGAAPVVCRGGRCCASRGCRVSSDCCCATVSDFAGAEGGTGSGRPIGTDAFAAGGTCCEPCSGLLRVSVTAACCR